MKKILVWDIPTRVFHWLLAISFTGAYLTAETERYRDIHLLLGYTLLGLIAFRLIWGFAGSRYSRFKSFLFSPSTIILYIKSLLQRNPQHYVGHNPAGGLAIFLLLGLGLLVSLSGVLLYFEVGGETFEDLHEVVANGMLLLVLVHIVGVIASSVLHRENLVRSMVTGLKSGNANQGITRAYSCLGAILLVVVAVFWLWAPQMGLLTSADSAIQASQSHNMN